jgi:trans-aconitate methyltransferase
MLALAVAVISSNRVTTLSCVSKVLCSREMSNTWDPNQYQHNTGFVPILGVPVLNLLGDVSGKRVLDLGCGDGVLTLELQQRGAEVVGVDASEPMVASAVSKGIDAHVVDAQQLNFKEEFDAVFTNATLHWVPNHDLVALGVMEALKPGGLFVGEFGGHGNIAAITTALYAILEQHGFPAKERYHWNFPSKQEFESRLVQAGFVNIEVQVIPRPTPLPTGIRGWLNTMANPFFEGINPDQKEKLLDEVEKLLSHSLQDKTGEWFADYLRLRFTAQRP